MTLQSQENTPTGLRRWLPRYDRSWLWGDVIAGLTVVALIVPEGMAYASLAGMPPETALYSAWIARWCSTPSSAARAVLDRSSATDEIGGENLHPRVMAAVAMHLNRTAGSRDAQAIAGDSLQRLAALRRRLHEALDDIEPT
jgi:hypothetical protein